MHQFFLQSGLKAGIGLKLDCQAAQIFHQAGFFSR
jgi:hypothetical protein